MHCQLQRKAVETMERRKRRRANPDELFVCAYTLCAIACSIAVGTMTECWVGLLVYAISTLELIVILIVTGAIGWWYR